MNVVYSSSDAYSELAAVSIVSLLENSRDANEINIYIIDKGISDQHKDDITEITNRYGRNVYFIENLDVEKIVNMSINVSKWHISTFSRLFLNYALPNNIDKIIYIDCDMIIRHSLKELWEMDMEGTWCMSADDCRGKLYRTNIGIDETSIYTNNGLMVIDLAAWRENRIEEKFIDFIIRYNGDVTYVDQGVLNGVLQPMNKVKLLPIKYNAQTICYDIGYDGMTLCRKPVWAYTKEEFNRDISDPVVVHFTSCFMSATRPWMKTDHHPYKEEFLHYRSMTAWKDEPLWEDNLSAKKKLVTKICQTLPRPITLGITRIAHVYLYPAIRSIKSRSHKQSQSNPNTV